MLQIRSKYMNGNRVLGYYIAQDGAGQGSLHDKDTVIWFVRQGQVENVEAVLDSATGQYSLRGKNGFRLDKIPVVRANSAESVLVAGPKDLSCPPMTLIDAELRVQGVMNNSEAPVIVGPMTTI